VQEIRRTKNSRLIMALPKVKDVGKESMYGYVFGVSGPGECIIPYQLV
jgi:hypothetical protein